MSRPNSKLPNSSSSQGVVQMAVAVRVLPSTRATSPRNPPFDIERTNRPMALDVDRASLTMT